VGEGRAERVRLAGDEHSRSVVREHRLTASDGLQIDPICDADPVPDEISKGIQNGGYVRASIRDRCHTK
jgi:hypothetical protein